MVGTLLRSRYPFPMRRLLIPYLSLLPFCGLMGAERPNIVLIMCDDLGWKDVAIQGNDKPHTPNLDALAKQGVRFTDAYSASPVCSPTRAALITALAPARLNILQHERVTIAERLRDAGYATGFFGKWHLSGTSVKGGDPSTGGPDFYPDRQGFDINIGGCGLGGSPTYFDPYRIPTITPRKTGEYLTDRLTDETINWMRKNKDKPMFDNL